MNPIFRGTVKDGKLKLYLRDNFVDYLHRLEGKTIEIIVREPKSIRSLAQNAYYHAVCVKMISEETGYSKEEAHDILRGLFLSREVKVAGKIVTVVKSSTDLNTKQFEDYLSEIRMWASKELSMFIPEPNQVDFGGNHD